MLRLPPGRYTLCGRTLDLPLVDQCGYLARRTTHPLPWHQHDGFELTYALRGSSVWDLTDGASLPLAGGHLALLPPGVLHHGEDALIRPMHLLWIVLRPQARSATRHAPFTRDDLDRLDASWRALGPSTTRMPTALCDLVAQLAQAVHAVATAAGSHSWARVRALLGLVMVESTLALQRREERGPVPAVEEAQRSMRTAVDAGESLPVRMIAARVGLGESRFHQLFLDTTGFTPAAWLRHLRCARARRLLLSNDESITLIAHGCGFASSQHLARCFRQEFGISPGAYRKREGKK